MPETKAKLRANVPDPRKPVNTRANEDVIKAMLKVLGPCCKPQAEKESWCTWEIEDGACMKCYHELMEAGLV